METSLPPAPRVVHWLDGDNYDPFAAWLERLNRSLRMRVEKCLERLRRGHPGRGRNLPKGLHELKIDVAGGLRIYYGRDGDRLVVILGGGDKSTQSKDIALAQKRWAAYLSSSRRERG